MHLQNILTMTVLALSHGVRAQSPTFQAFDGDYCDGDGGNVDAFDGNTRSILTAERHSYYIGGDLPNGATVILFENLDCDGSSGGVSQYGTSIASGSCMNVNTGWNWQSALIWAD